MFHATYHHAGESRENVEKKCTIFKKKELLERNREIKCIPLITLSFNPEAGVFNIVRFLFTYLQTFDTILETGL